MESQKRQNLIKGGGGSDAGMSVSLEQEADGTLNQDNVSMLAKGIIHKGVDRL